VEAVRTWMPPLRVADKSTLSPIYILGNGMHFMLATPVAVNYYLKPFAHLQQEIMPITLWSSMMATGPDKPEVSSL